VKITDLIACPTCHARITQACRARSGGPNGKPHPNRLVAQRCVCGAVKPRHRKLCPPCAKENRRISNLYSARRKRRRQMERAA
jgi:hypothetical protein